MAGQLWIWAKNKSVYKAMLLFLLHAKITQDQLLAQSSVLRKQRKVICLALIILYAMDRRSKLKQINTFIEKRFSLALLLLVLLLILLNHVNKKPVYNQMKDTQELGSLTLLTLTSDLKCKVNQSKWEIQSFSATAKLLTIQLVTTLDTATILAANLKSWPTLFLQRTRPKISSLRRQELSLQTSQQGTNLNRTNGAWQLLPMPLSRNQSKIFINSALMTLLPKSRLNF